MEIRQLGVSGRSDQERAMAAAVELDDSHTGTAIGRVMNYHDY